MHFLNGLFLFSPMKEKKKFTNVFTQNIFELATLQAVIEEEGVGLGSSQSERST